MHFQKQIIHGKDAVLYLFQSKFEESYFETIFYIVVKHM